MSDLKQAEHTGSGHGGPHIVPLKVLLSVFGGLVVLTWITVAATWLDLGAGNLWLALAIATVKGTLVALFFMHLRWDRPVNAVIFIGTLFFVLLFVGIALTDTASYQPEMIPGYRIEEAMTAIDPKTPPAAGASAGKLGMRLFLLALGVLFAASMAGYLVVRLRAPEWPPAGSPRLPGGLWISTLILLFSSGTMATALGAARGGKAAAARNGLLITFVLGVVFLISQVLNWHNLIVAHQLPANKNLYAFTFYLLSGLHGAHVLGGLVPLVITTIRAGRGRYTAQAHAGVEYMSMYWHFLDVVWVVMFIVLQIAA